MAATIITKDGKEHKCLRGDADELAKSANGGAKFLKCGNTWIAVSDIKTISLEADDKPEVPPSIPDRAVHVHHNHYYAQER
ncbi:hypothetical protein DU002_14300 [Corallincola holothuriorum]|uniref:Uncharacterized protein n=1 Tax=Corallincola holothuriorum TaxID=2282215 RepID=A0A368N6K4_9GAMM|nr:hypothetical protein [Corallincola holothuriorum]RCU45633.1 hypothetical protein DU002_14300 [Corallincola holothuriorum]